jgi:phosphoesterase RecJ-like protein
MNETIQKLGSAVEEASTVLVIQAENPDGDSIGSALALEQILEEKGKTVHLYCPVSIPKYLKYLSGWDRITNDFPSSFDIAIIVDASTTSVLDKAISGSQGATLSSKPVFVIDHHDATPDIPFRTFDIIDPTAVSASQVVYEVAMELNWKLDTLSGSAITAAIMSDSLGLISRKTTARTVRIVAEMIEKYGVSLSDLEDARREHGKKTREILAYKGKLLERVEYLLDNRLAVITIPYEEITTFSDQYNPSMLVMEELRGVEGVDMAIAFKTYPDRITGKLRAYSKSSEVCHKIAEEFGGGGHPFAAGFKVFNANYDQLKSEVLASINKHLVDKQES